MLCSIPTLRSSSDWLDRLRTSKGFPDPTGLDLEHFLHSNFAPCPNPTPSDAIGSSASIPPAHQKKQQSNKKLGCEKEQRLFDLMSNVLSELFVMGDPREPAAARKSSRKQLNPRLCVSSSSASADVGASRQAPAAMSPSIADNSVAEDKRDRKKMKRLRVNAGQADPLVNIGTVVTVIDTSIPGWKTERHFRKGMSWKGREKKAWNVCRKKKKLGVGDKLNVEKEKLRPLAELKGREHDRNVKLLNEEYAPSINEENARNSEYNHTQIPRRPKFLRSPRLPVKTSSLFRLKVIAKNQKAGLTINS